MNAKKIKLNKRLTALGKIIDWSDSVYISKKITFLLFLVLLSGLIVSKQVLGWGLLNTTKAAALQGSPLPEFSPEKGDANDTVIGHESKQGISGIASELSLAQFVFKKNAEEIIQDKPMQNMIEAVAKRDTQTAAYLVAIAKKESNSGKFAPKDENGKECYNYWGYRGSQKTTKSGYSCFDSPEQAVGVVGDRIQILSQIGERDTPREMVIWKCGANCAAAGGHAAAKKWIADVALYYEKLNL